MDRSRFLHLYYVLNSTLMAAYILLRVQRLHPGELSREDMFGVSREAQIYICLGMLLFVRSLSAPTVDAYISTAFNLARVTVLLCLWYMDSRLAAIFLFLWTIIYVVCPQPRYRLPSSIATLTTPSFNERIERNENRTMYVLWCHAPWSSRCSQLTPVLASLAKSYEHPRVCFARIDVSRFADTADKLKVSISPTSKQLPCVISFKQGKEVARIPIIDAAGRVPKQWSRGFTAKNVAQQLKLDALYEQAVKWEEEAKKRYQKKKD